MTSDRQDPWLFALCDACSGLCRRSHVTIGEGDIHMLGQEPCGPAHAWPDSLMVSIAVLPCAEGAKLPAATQLGIM